MIFYSHSQKNSEGKKEGSKFLRDHNEGVKENALNGFYDQINLPYEIEYLKQILSDVCDLHDLGKYTQYFQKYLLGESMNFNANLKRHSFIGACTIFNKYWEQNDFISVICYFLILKHHDNLNEFVTNFKGAFLDARDYNENVLWKQKQSILSEIEIVENELKGHELAKNIDFPNFQKGRKKARQFERNPNIQNYFLTNYLFSLLIEGDKLDASDTETHTRNPIPISVVDDYIVKIIKERNIDLTNPQNKLRKEVREIVVGHLRNDEILKERLFTLTAPTGIGKTLTSLDFAIKLKAKIKEKEGRDAQIICALPFINIIEQTLSEYQNVLPKDIELLAHYQFADVFEQDRKGEANREDEKAYNEKLMQLDTWQCDVVITSFVQLLHTLIGYRNKILKKFNHLAGSIIIMDEVQNIALNLVPLVGASLYYLAEILDARIILMTATEPLIFPLANKEILNMRSVEAKAFPLLPNAKSVFQKFKRTKLVPLDLEKGPIQVEDFLEVFENKWKSQNSCLIVCNTVNRSIEVFNKIKELIEDQDDDFINPVYYLSTNTIPFHRLDTIKKIKKDLKSEEKNIKPILVATQCVEAGVDLDFDIGFRDISPIDSIVQVAGRVNRNNDPDREYSPVYIMNFGDCDKVYGRHSSTQVKEALKTESGEILERDYYDLVEKYFAGKSETYEPSRNIFKAMETLKYDGIKDEIDDYKTVSSFQVIEGNNKLRSVFIATNENIDLSKHKSAKQVLIAFEKLKNKKIGKNVFNKDFKRDFQQRIVTVPEYYLNHLDEERFKITDDIYQITDEFIGDLYIETGFNRNVPDAPIYLSF